MVKAANQIFPGEEVHPGFPANGRVNLRKQGRGNLHVGNSSHINGREEAGYVADDASTKGDKQGIPVGSGFGELFGERLYRREAFVLFAWGKKEDRRTLCFWKGAADLLRPELPDLGRSDENGPEGSTGRKRKKSGVERLY